ncbi:MAG: glycogen/starch synthase, partial [Candidatus Omnitrophota bacterium]
TSAAVRAVLLIWQGFVHGVSDAHAQDVREYDPQIWTEAIYAMTNGDLIPRSLFEFARIFVSRYGNKDTKREMARLTKQIKDLSASKDKDDLLKAALLRKELEALLYRQMRGFRDDPDTSYERKKEMFVKTQKLLKSRYLKKYIVPFFSAAGIDMPFLKEEDSLKKLTDMLWLGYIGRFVEEKRGSERAFRIEKSGPASESESNLELLAKLGVLTLILGRVTWAYDPAVNALKLKAGEINNVSSGYAGKIVFKDSFPYEEQLCLILALGVQMQDSNIQVHFQPDRDPSVELTEACGATESHVLMNTGHSARQYIHFIGSVLNRVFKRGSNPVPMDEDPRSYAELYRWLVEKNNSGELMDYLFAGFNEYAVCDEMLTAIEIARQFDRIASATTRRKTVSYELFRETSRTFTDDEKAAFPSEEAFKDAVIGRAWPSRAEELIEELKVFERPEHEVAVKAWKFEIILPDETGQGKDTTIELPHEGFNGKFYEAPLKGEKVRISVSVDPRGVGEEWIQAYVKTQGIIMPLYSKETTDGFLVFERELPRDFILRPFEAEIRVSSGMAAVKIPVTLTPQISSATLWKIKEEAEKRFEYLVASGAKDIPVERRPVAEEGKEQTAMRVISGILPGRDLRFKVRMPFSDRGIIDRLEPLVKVNMLTGSQPGWRLLSENEFSYRADWKAGWLYYEITIHRITADGEFYIDLGDRFGIKGWPQVWGHEPDDNVVVKLAEESVPETCDGSPVTSADSINAETGWMELDGGKQYRFKRGAGKKTSGLPDGGTRGRNIRDSRKGHLDAVFEEIQSARIQKRGYRIQGLNPLVMAQWQIPAKQDMDLYSGALALIGGIELELPYGVGKIDVYRAVRESSIVLIKGDRRSGVPAMYFDLVNRTLYIFRGLEEFSQEELALNIISQVLSAIARIRIPAEDEDSHKKMSAYLQPDNFGRAIKVLRPDWPERPFRSLNIAEISPEVTRLTSKVGGLADVAYGLPRELALIGHNVDIFTLKYNNPGNSPADRGLRYEYIGSVWVPVGEKWTVEVKVHRTNLHLLSGMEGLKGCLRGYVLEPAGGSSILADYPYYGKFGLEQDILLSRASLQAMKDLPGLREKRYDIVHAHDKDAALSLVYKDSLPEFEYYFQKTQPILTIHNIRHQGVHSFARFPALGLPERYRSILNNFGSINLLKAGLFKSNRANTVSERHAYEVTTAEGGRNLDWLLARMTRESSFYGILNGINDTYFNPMTDAMVAFPYDFSSEDVRESREQKRNNKERLQVSLGLTVDRSAPLVALIARLDEQKGLRLLAPKLRDILRTNPNAQIIIVGREYDKEAVDMIRWLPFEYEPEGRWDFRGRAYVLPEFLDENLVHLIYASADIFLVPSLDEPCGLTQMIAAYYGTPSVVRYVGGLADSIENYEPSDGTGYGFVFFDPTPEALQEAVQRALNTYADENNWLKVLENLRKVDFSWKNSAARYEVMYWDALTFSGAEKESVFDADGGYRELTVISRGYRRWFPRSGTSLVDLTVAGGRLSGQYAGTGIITVGALPEPVGARFILAFSRLFRKVSFLELNVKITVYNVICAIGVCLNNKGKAIGYLTSQPVVVFTPLEKATDFSRWSSDSQADGGLMPPSAQTVRGRSSLTGFTTEGGERRVVMGRIIKLFRKGLARNNRGEIGHWPLLSRIFVRDMGGNKAGPVERMYSSTFPRSLLFYSAKKHNSFSNSSLDGGKQCGSEKAAVSGEDFSEIVRELLALMKMLLFDGDMLIYPEMLSETLYGYISDVWSARGHGVNLLKKGFHFRAAGEDNKLDLELLVRKTREPFLTIDILKNEIRGHGGGNMGINSAGGVLSELRSAGIILRGRRFVVLNSWSDDFGFKHILARHANEFAAWGINSPEKIAALIIEIVEKGRVLDEGVLSAVIESPWGSFTVRVIISICGDEVTTAYPVEKKPNFASVRDPAGPQRDKRLSVMSEILQPLPSQEREQIIALISGGVVNKRDWEEIASGCSGILRKGGLIPVRRKGTSMPPIVALSQTLIGLKQPNITDTDVRENKSRLLCSVLSRYLAMYGNTPEAEKTGEQLSRAMEYLLYIAGGYRLNIPRRQLIGVLEEAARISSCSANDMILPGDQPGTWIIGEKGIKALEMLFNPGVDYLQQNKDGGEYTEGDIFLDWDNLEKPAISEELYFYLSDKGTTIMREQVTEKLDNSIVKAAGLQRHVLFHLRDENRQAVRLSVFLKLLKALYGETPDNIRRIKDQIYAEIEALSAGRATGRVEIAGLSGSRKFPIRFSAGLIFWLGFVVSSFTYSESEKAGVRLRLTQRKEVKGEKWLGRRSAVSSFKRLHYEIWEYASEERIHSVQSDFLIPFAIINMLSAVHGIDFANPESVFEFAGKCDKPLRDAFASGCSTGLIETNKVEHKKKIEELLNIYGFVPLPEDQSRP